MSLEQIDLYEDYEITRGQGELRFSRLNVCIAFLDRYSSYGSYKTPLIQREFELKQIDI